jgi:hypothetical protein
MKAYETATDHYHGCKLGTKKHELAGKRLDKACEAIEQFRANNKAAH